MSCHLDSLIKSESVSHSVCPTLCKPMDYSQPGSSVHGILQAKMQEWAAILFSRGSFRPKDESQLFPIVSRCTDSLLSEAPGKPFPLLSMHPREIKANIEKSLIYMNIYEKKVKVLVA